MRASYVTRLGPVSGIRYGELPDPEPGPHQILVRVEATTVNTVDTFVRSGAFRTPVHFPLTLGRDLGGVVVASGGDVEAGRNGPRPGARVWTNSAGYEGRPGASAEFVPVTCGCRLVGWFDRQLAGGDSFPC